MNDKPLTKTEIIARIEEISDQIVFAAGEQQRLTWRIADMNAQVQRHAKFIQKLDYERARLIGELQV